MAGAGHSDHPRHNNISAAKRQADKNQKMKRSRVDQDFQKRIEYINLNEGCKFTCLIRSNQTKSMPEVPEFDCIRIS